MQEILGFETFVNYVKDFVESMHGEGSPFTAAVKRQPGINGENVWLELSSPEFGSTLPCIKMKDEYERYCEIGGMEYVKGLNTQIPKIVKSVKENAVDTSAFLRENAAKNLMLELVNTERNKGMLENVPHRKFLDLSIIYTVKGRKDKDSIPTVRVTNKNMAHFGFKDEAELFETAKRNTKRLLGGIMTVPLGDMAEKARNALGEDAVLDDEEAVKEAMEELNQSFVITTNDMYRGASLMVYPDVLSSIYDGGSFYILPSSRDDLIAVHSDSDDVQEMLNWVYSLEDMVNSINMTVLNDRDYLSDSIYIYHDRKVSRCSMQPDGTYIIAESCELS